MDLKIINLRWSVQILFLVGLLLVHIWFLLLLTFYDAFTLAVTWSLAVSTFCSWSPITRRGKGCSLQSLPRDIQMLHPWDFYALKSLVVNAILWRPYKFSSCTISHFVLTMNLLISHCYWLSLVLDCFIKCSSWDRTQIWLSKWFRPVTDGHLVQYLQRIFANIINPIIVWIIYRLYCMLFTIHDQDCN